MASKRRYRRASLACFVQALEGTRVVVELRHDTIIRGELLSCDEQLNLQLGSATQQPLQGAKREMEYVYIKGRHVRFVHLPGNLDPAAAIEQHRKRVAQAVRQHAAQQAQAAQQPGARLQKGTQLELGRTEQRQQQLLQQQPAGARSSSGGCADMDTS